MDETDIAKHYHFIGIGGIGMSALARLLLQQKIKVTGSDLKNSPTIDALEKKGAKVHIGHSSDYVQKGMTVIYSTGVPEGNVEYQRALQLKCPTLHRQELLSLLTEGQKMVAVAGTHGKTTTSALLAAVLDGVGSDPSFMVGGIVNQYGANSKRGSGEIFVSEVDESDGSFVKNHPYGAIVTNIDLDHMNHYKTEEALISSFQQFLSQVESKEHLFWCCDDERLVSLKPNGISYGFSKKAELQITTVEPMGWNTSFSFLFEGRHYKDVIIPMIGKHNVLNAAAVFGVALKLGADEEKIREALKAFQGIKRRADRIGKAGTIEIIDDYAHHPTEVEATLASLRQAVAERRIIAVFQPHRYSRLQAFQDNLNETFKEADLVVIADIYTAGEHPSMGICFEAFVQYAKDSCPRVVQVSNDALLGYLEKIAQPHDLFVFLGAGDITHYSRDFFENLNGTPEKKIKVSLICGGANSEHEVSLVSAGFIERSLNRSRYDVSIFEINKEGVWSKRGGASGSSALNECMQGDMMFPMIHGPLGEDGTLQGLFELFKKPYVGMDFRAAAICMDKALTKKLVQLAGVRTAPFVEVRQSKWKKEQEEILEQASFQLKFPVIIKGVHQGSSIGVVSVASLEELPDAINEAFKYDHHLIIENRLKGREIEFAVLGNETIHAFPPGEILTNGEIYDYEKKYGDTPFLITVNPKMPEEAIKRGCELAKKAYNAVGAQGMARVDFFYDDTEKFWLNEINPIPGMTKISLYPQICEREGITAEELMDNLIILALHKHRTCMIYG